MKHVKKHKVTVSIGNSDGGNIIIPDDQSVNVLPGATASNTFTFIVKPKAGYKFDSAFTCGSYNTNYLATTDSGNTSASINSDGNMVISTKLNSFKMLPENIELDLPLVTSGKISTNDFTLAGTFNKTITNSSINDIDGGGVISATAADGSSWTTSGTSNSSETLLNVLVTPQSNHEFTDDNLPQLVVSGEIQDNYEVTGPTAQGTGYTFKVVGSRVNKNLTAENIKIISSPNKAVSLETNAIFAAEISQSAFSKDEEEREIIIRGSVGAQVLLSASVVSSTGTDLAINILDGNGFSTGQKTVTIGSDGQAKAIIKVTANSTSGERNVYVLLDETTGYVITDEFDDTDGVDDGQVLYTIKQTLRVGVAPFMTDSSTTSPLPSTPTNSLKNTIQLTNKSLLGDLGNVANPTTSTTLIKNIANTEDPVENNVFNVLYQLRRDNSNDDTSVVVKVDDLDVVNDFLNPDGTNPYDSDTGFLILANGTQLKVIDHNFGQLGTGGRGGINVQFEVIKFGSADDTFYLNTVNVLELSNNVKTSGSAGTVSTTTLTGQGSYINSDIEELSGSTFTDLADNAPLQFMYRVTFTDAAHGKYIDNLKVVVDNFGGTGSVDNNTSDATLVLESGKGDKFGRIKSGDTAIANFKVLANGAISNGSTVTADVTVSNND